MENRITTALDREKRIEEIKKEMQYHVGEKDKHQKVINDLLKEQMQHERLLKKRNLPRSTRT